MKETKPPKTARRQGGWLRRLFAGGPAADAPLAYEEVARLARDGDTATRRNLAGRADTPGEILCFLAADPDSEVRRRVAANPTTPIQADLVLAQDLDDDVRSDVARKIARLAPELDSRAQDKLRGLTFEALQVLAHDQLPRVRRIVAQEIKHSPSVPRAMVNDLARDIELVVAAPILRYSPLLSDGDLLEIIRSGPIQGALTAIAQREELAAPVSSAIGDSDDAPVITTLINNAGAHIDDRTMDGILSRAPAIEAWHEPLALRRDLSPRAVQRIAQFVSQSLLTGLEERHALGDGITRDVAKAVNRRLRANALTEGSGAEKANLAFEAGTLDEEQVAEAVMNGDREFVTHALALRAAMPVDIVARILGVKAAKAVTSLAWKAGLSMRTGIQLQSKIANIAPNGVLNAKNGVDFPLGRDEMQWLLDFHSG